MKKLLVIVFFLASAVYANSQNLTVEGTAPDLYITHTVAPKENFYSIGRLYNQSPKVIAAFNEITMEKGLTIGQHVKIPLNTQNLDISGKANPGESLIPITHIVAKSETLFKIGTDYKVTAQLLREWNGLASDNITPGAPLIVGHLKVGNSQAVAANSGGSSSTANTPAVTTTPVVTNAPNITTTPVVTTETPVVTIEKPVAKPEAPAVTKETAVIKSETISEAKPASGAGSAKKDDLFESVTPVDNKESGVAAKTQSSAPQSTNSGTVKSDLFESVKPADKTIGTTTNNTASTVPVQKESAPVTTGSISAAPGDSESKKVKNTEDRKTDFSSYGSIEGVFAANFANNNGQKAINSLSGEAATFKSTSGWQDKRYYVLINDVAPGTIVKISSAENKVVYAKVLGSMPEMKENTGLLLRISNSAASYLGIIDPKFPVQVSYYQ